MPRTVAFSYRLHFLCRFLNVFVCQQWFKFFLESLFCSLLLLYCMVRAAMKHDFPSADLSTLWDGSSACCGERDQQLCFVFSTRARVNVQSVIPAAKCRFLTSAQHAAVMFSSSGKLGWPVAGDDSAQRRTSVMRWRPGHLERTRCEPTYVEMLLYSPSAHSTRLNTPSSRSKVTVCSWYSFVAHWQSCLVSHGKLWRARIAVFCESAPSPLSPEEILVQLWRYSGKRRRGGQSKMLECLSAIINQTNLEPAVTNIMQQVKFTAGTEFCPNVLLTCVGDFNGTQKNT